MLNYKLPIASKLVLVRPCFRFALRRSLTLLTGEVKQASFPSASCFALKGEGEMGDNFVFKEKDGGVAILLSGKKRKKYFSIFHFQFSISKPKVNS